MGEIRTATETLAKARRVVVKIGSSLLVGSDGDVHRAWLAELAADLAQLRAEGRKVAIVSSGAVALGLKRLGLARSARLDRKQAAAAAGQGLLMQAYDEALRPHGLIPAQLLLTYDDTERRRRWLNARATMEVLLAQGAVPVINENDSVATDELRYGDNDRLSARVAQMIRADLLVLLSDVDGLYTADPSRDPAAEHIPFVERLTPDLEAMAGGVGAAGTGSGGMRTKLAAAQIAAAAGCATLIACGRADRPLSQLRQGVKATLIAPETSVSSAYKQWISGTLSTAGVLTVDDGAAQALAGGRSLLAAGVRGVEGEFERGACVSVRTHEGAEIARGLVGYDAEETRRVAGQASKALPAILGYDGPAELIHRNDLVMTRR